MNKENKLLELLNLNGSRAIQQEEFADVVKTLLEVIKALRQNIDDSLSSKMTKKEEDLIARLEKSELNVQMLLNQLETNSNTSFSSLNNQLQNEIKRVESIIPQMPDLSIIEKRLANLSSELSLYADNLKAVEGKIPTIEKTTGEMIIDKINATPIQDDLLFTIERIRGLKEWLEKLERMERNKITSVAGGGLGGSGGVGGWGRLVKSYDLSNVLNGVTKTFTLPALWRVISVHSSSFPGAFRETTDYIFTSSSITFTSEITAATTLASGQTIIVIYCE